MGLLQKAVETFDCHASYVGKMKEGHAVLAPVSHITTSAQIEIKIDLYGNLCEASSLDKAEPKIVIPVTEESAGRANAPCAHPLCDQLSYLAPYDELVKWLLPKEKEKQLKKFKDRHQLYLKQLTEWTKSQFSHPKLKPILAYVEKGSILQDLVQRGVIQLNDDGSPKKKEQEKDLVRWLVTGLDSGVEACWADETLFQAYINYYNAQKAHAARSLCMISGQELSIASQHPKGIIPVNGNAKLISANDSSGFTYRGRFTEDWQASSVSYEASQKAHNALRWLAAEQGVAFGGRTFLCWNPQGRKVCGVTMPFRPVQAVTTKPSDYRERLLKTLEGYRRELPEKAGVVIAAFDAATTGRLSLTYYNELMGSDFLQRLYDWDRTCWWYHGKYGVQSPLLYQIVNCAFGVQRVEKGRTLLKTDDRVTRQQMQRLVACRVDRAGVSIDIVSALVQRASTPQAFDTGVWREIVYTACALLQKYLLTQKGVDEMPWELDKPDRSFQFGRLLAVMERVERDFYFENDPKDKSERQTSALKAMSRFRQHPLNVYVQVNQHLNEAYVPRLKNPWYRERYERLRSEIMGIMTGIAEAEQLNLPLDDVYIIGYDLQRAAFFKKKDDEGKFNDRMEEQGNEYSEE